MNRTPSAGSVFLALFGLTTTAIGLAASVTAASNLSAQRVTPVVRAVERTAPAVASVTTVLNGGRARGSGAGVIVHPDGYVVTNSHVVRGASRVFVSLAKTAGGRAYEARILEDDPAHDLALLRIANKTPFTYVGLCSTCDVVVGETAIAIGNPFGLGDTVTVGIVSAKGRSASLSTGQTIRNLIQTDASINQGNSGGALLNLDGELIGINCSIHPSAQGIAFTVPADDVQAMLDRNLGPASRPAPPPGPTIDLDALEEGKLSQALPPAVEDQPAPTPRYQAPLAQRTPGIVIPTPAPPPPPVPAKAAVGLMLRQTPGAVLVASVVSNSNADIAGIAAGDVILDVDGKATTSPSDLAKLFSASPSGRTYFVNLMRGDRKTNAILVIP